MVVQIRLNTEGLTTSASTLRQQGNDLETLINQMQTVIDGLAESWEGAAAEAYAAQFTNLKPGLIQTRELVETIAVQIEQTLQAAEELDANIAGQFR